MPKNRLWRKWPSRFLNELNGIAGVAGIGGTAIGAAGWTALAGTAAAVSAGAGIFITVGAVAVAAVKAVPPASKSPQDLTGSIVTLEDLDLAVPRPSMLSIVGPSKTGKTTLRNRLAFDPSEVKRTQKITAYVASLPPIYVAALDAGGERYPQQFRIAELCDVLCIVLDHNESDTESKFDPARIKRNEEFCEQIRLHLEESKSAKKNVFTFC